MILDKKYFGIDVGGTFIKGVIADGEGNVLSDSKIPTESRYGGERIISNILHLCDSLLNEAGIKKGDVSAIGIGIPGIVDTRCGTVVFSANLGLENFDIASRVNKATSLPVKVANDANAAALGEMKFGFKNRYKNIVFLTLGTGVGGGIIIDGALYEGCGGAGAEIGHTVIDFLGEPCSCGRRGCIEAYSSATALIRDTKRAMAAHRDSKLWEIATPDSVDGKTAFDCYERDPYAKEVIDNYISRLACAITNMANLFRPEAVILGGGISAQGDRLTKPLQKIVDREIFAKENGPRVEILTAKLKNDAGALGAASLVI